MKNKIWLLSLLLLTIGCTEVVVTKIVGPETETQTVNLRVNWNQIANSISATTDSITHIGVRLVYVKEGAVFMQSVRKTDSSSNGLITLKVPSTDTAHLFVVAVKRDENTNYNKLIKLGAKFNISIPTNGTINLTLDSITMNDAKWEVDTTALRVVYGTTYTPLSNDSLYNGRVVASKNDSLLVFPIHVYDPFYSKNVHGTTGIITFYGGGSDWTDKINWSGFGIWMKNSSVGTTGNTRERFWPYLEGSMFNLPSGGYKIGNEGIINVIWQ